MDAKRDLKLLRPCLKASRFHLKRVKDRPYYLGLTSGRSVSINANKTRKHFSEIFMARACFVNVSQFTQISFSKVEICLCYIHGREFYRKSEHASSCKLLRARAGEDSSRLFCEQFEQTPNFAITFKLNGTIRYPFEGLTDTCANRDKCWPLFHF